MSNIDEMRRVPQSKAAKAAEREVRQVFDKERISIPETGPDRVKRIMGRAHREVAVKDLINFLFVRIWQPLIRLGGEPYRTIANRPEESNENPQDIDHVERQEKNTNSKEEEP